MRRLVLLGVILAAAAGISSTAAPEPPADLAGTYRCDGKNPDGTAYHGVVDISKVRDTFRVRWTMGDGAVMGVGIYSGAIRNFSASINLNANSAPPLTIRTGRDDNGDLVFNDRPAGVGRNSERTSGQISSSGSFSYTFNLGKRTIATGPGVGLTSLNGVISVSSVASQSASRYRLTISASVNNLTNHHNLTGYSGVMTSPYFLKATNVSGVRRITFNSSLSF